MLRWTLMSVRSVSPTCKVNTIDIKPKASGTSKRVMIRLLAKRKAFPSPCSSALQSTPVAARPRSELECDKNFRSGVKIIAGLVSMRADHWYCPS